MAFDLKNKKFLFPLLGILIGAIILCGTSLTERGERSARSDEHSSPGYGDEALTTYTETLEKKIKELIGHIGGVSDVSVLLTVDASTETVYATSGQNRDYVIIKDSSGNESPIEVREICAGIRGIAVVCDYGGDESRKKEILEMLSSLFAIGTNRISVLAAD